MRETNTDLFDPRTDMESDFSRGASSSDGDFGFAFNDSNFSDRLLRIEIMDDAPDDRPDGESCNSIADWARHRKRRREDIKKDNGSFSLCVISFIFMLNRILICLLPSFLFHFCFYFLIFLFLNFGNVAFPCVDDGLD